MVIDTKPGRCGVVIVVPMLPSSAGGVDDTYTTVDSAADDNPLVVTVADEDGIASVELIEIRDLSLEDPEMGIDPPPVLGGTLPVSNIRTLGFELELIDDIDLNTNDGLVTEKTFDVGFYFSEGTAQGTSEIGLEFISSFLARDPPGIGGTPNADPDFLACTGECADSKLYDVLFNNAAGFGELTSTVRQDSGKGFGVQPCKKNPPGDVDKDGICDKHEDSGSGKGVPHVSFGKKHRYPMEDLMPDPEKIYKDVDGSETRNAGDVRLVGTASDGSTILSGDTDNDDAVLTSFTNEVLYVNAGGPSTFNPGVDAIYEDNDGDTAVSAGDRRIANTIFDGVLVFTGDSDIGDSLLSFSTVKYLDADDSGVYETDPGTGSDMKDFIMEIDYMDDGMGATHEPDPLAMRDVKDLFAFHDVRLHIIKDKKLPEVTLFKMWKDGDRGPTSFDNDFNSVKSVNFGITNVIQPFITKEQVNTVTAVSEVDGDYLVTVTGLDVSTVCNPNTTTGGGVEDRSKGQIALKIRMDLNQPTDIEITPGEEAEMAAPGGGFFVTSSSPDVRSITQVGGGANTDKDVITVVIDWSTNFGWGNSPTCPKDQLASKFVRDPKTMPDILIPIRISPTQFGTAIDVIFDDSDGSTSGVQQENQPIHPKINSQLRIGWAQDVRYCPFIHSYGGPSGLAETRGNDCVVSLGDGFDLNWRGHPGGSRHEQSGTAAHEWAHLLNSGHGGARYLIGDVAQTLLGDADTNCKENFPDILSYSRQLPTVGLLMDFQQVVLKILFIQQVSGNYSSQMAHMDTTQLNLLILITQMPWRHLAQLQEEEAL